MRTPSSLVRLLAAGVATLLLTPGCTEGAADSTLSIVATTTIWGDVAANVARSDATVETLIPLGADPHDYRASSREVAVLHAADLVIANGLGLEEGLNDVLEGAESDGVRVLRVGELLDPLPLAGDPTGLDPHVWLDPMRVAAGATLIAQELTAVDPYRDWKSGADEYVARLQDTDATIRELLERVAIRELVTSHDSLGYFADRYGFEVIGVVIPGGSTLAEPSSADLAALADLIRTHAVPALFAETTHTADLTAALAAESGREVQVVELFTGSLGEPGSGAENLIDMLLTNAARIAEALG